MRQPLAGRTVFSIFIRLDFIGLFRPDLFLHPRMIYPIDSWIQTVSGPPDRAPSGSRADAAHPADLDPSQCRRPHPESRGTSNRRACTATATRGVCPETPQAEAISARPSILGRDLAPLATLEESPCRCSPGDRSSLAPQRVPPLLAIYLDARPWAAADL